MKIKSYLRTFAEILLTIAACVFIYCVIKLVPALVARDYTGQTLGTASIVTTVEDSGGNAGGTKHRVYVDYCVDGKDYFTVVIHGRFDDPRVGDTYHIRYDINNPEKCYVGSNPNDSLEYYGAGMLVSVVFAAVGLLGVKYLKPKQENE